MDDTERCTLSQLLPARLDGIGHVVRQGLPEPLPCDDDALAHAACAPLRAACDVDVFELLATAWSRARDLARYTDPGRYPPGQPLTVHLGEHDTPALHLHPLLEVRLGDLPPARLRFTLELGAHVRAVALMLRDGCITGVAAGDIQLHAQLAYQEVALHREPVSQSLKLGRPLRFAEPGIRIAREGGDGGDRASESAGKSKKS